MRKYLAGLITAGIMLAPVASADHSPRVRIPHCFEDEGFLEGVGNWDGSRWDRYECRHPDEIVRTEEVHRALVERICTSSRARRHWERTHGVQIMPESCDGF